MTTVVQAKHGQANASTSAAVTLSAAPTVGNLLIALVTASGTVGSPVHPWGATPDATHAPGRVVYLLSKIAGSSESATVTFSNANSLGLTISVIEVSATPGMTWAGVDVTATGTNASTVTSLALGPTAGLSSSDQIAVAAVAVSSSTGVISGWSNSFNLITGPDTTSRGFSGYLVLASASAVSTTGTWTSARTCAGLLATYKQTASGPPASAAAFLAFM